MGDGRGEFVFAREGGPEVRVEPLEGGYRLTLVLTADDPDLVRTAWEQSFTMRAAADTAGRFARGVELADAGVAAALEALAAELAGVPAAVREKLVNLLAFELYDREPDDEARP